MLKCRDLASKASDYVDDQATIRLRWSIRLHLLTCVNCRRFMQQFRLGQVVFRRLPEPESGISPDELADRLWTECRNKKGTDL